MSNDSDRESHEKERRASTASRVRAKSTGIPWQSRVGDLVDTLLAGGPLEPACVKADVSIDTVRHAIERGDPDAAPIVEALAAYESR